MAIRDIPINLEIIDDMVYLVVDRIGHPMPLAGFLRIAKDGPADRSVLLVNAALQAGLKGATTKEEVLTALKGATLKG